MGREIRPTGALAEQSDPVLPDHVPNQPPAYGPTRAPLVLYIYRVPGKRDLFLTQHKILDNRPTSYDVNSCVYYIRYDGCMTDKDPDRQAFPTTASPATPLQRPTESGLTLMHDHDAGSVWRHEWQNLSQQSLRDRGLAACGVQMALVGVDTLRSDIRNVAILQDPKIFTKALGSDRELVFPPSPLFIDILSEAYEAFGHDIAYSEGRAFTRCLRRPDSRNAAFEFASPWHGTVSLEPHAQLKGSIHGFHRPYRGHSVDARLACELRPNFSSQWRRRSPTKTQASATADRWRSSFQSDEDDPEGGLSRLAKIRARSSQLTESTRDSVGFLMSTRGRALRKGGQRPEYSFNLAQEPLGGGGGDEAKLGKLIVHADGQDFVDLIVAANMLLFNRLYENAMPWLHTS